MIVTGKPSQRTQDLLDASRMAYGSDNFDWRIAEQLLDRLREDSSSFAQSRYDALRNKYSETVGAPYASRRT